MKTILIPIDFSIATQHVLSYVSAASKDIKIERVILLTSMYTSVYQQIVFSAEYMCLNESNFEAERRGILDHIENLCLDFSEGIALHTKVEKALTELPLINAISQLIRQEKPDMLVLNSDQDNPDAGYIGKNVIPIVKSSTIPILIIPPNADYQKFRSALIPIDFQALDRLTVFRQSLAITSDIKPLIKVLNISKKGDFEHERHNLLRLLTGFSVSVHQMDNPDILDGILDFVEQNNLQLIMALPGKYNFFKRLTHRSITQTIALKSNLPVLILKQR